MGGGSLRKVGTCISTATYDYVMGPLGEDGRNREYELGRDLCFRGTVSGLGTMLGMVCGASQTRSLFLELSARKALDFLTRITFWAFVGQNPRH